MSAALNANCSGAWSAREGEPVEYVETKPNGKAVGVRLAGEKRVVFLPRRWVDGIEPEPPPLVCPTCGRPI